MDFSNFSSSMLFKGIEPENLQSAFSTILFQQKQYEKDALLAEHGSDCDRLIFITKGEVRGQMSDRQGKTIKIEDIKAPSPLASAFIFGQQSRFPVDIIANTDTEAVIIYKDQLLKLFQCNELILSNFLSLISTRAQFLTQKIKFLSFGTLQAKLAHYFTQRAGDNLKSFPIGKTQQQLAELFGVQRPSLARALKEMQEKGLIELEQKTVTILDKKALLAIMK